MMRWYGGGLGLLGWFGTVVFWFILLGLIVWLLVRVLPNSGAATRSTGQSPLEILDRRLASGEIDLETWRAHRAALLGTQGERR
jgi:putative membrane protein